LPIFALLKEICIVRQNLVTEELLTVSHNKHLNVFEVEVKPSQELVLLKQDGLSYGFPLHLISISLEEQVKTFVCPKYQIPTE
jgi:hypothetical protein